MQKDEQTLFPMLRSGEPAMELLPVQVMHGGHVLCGEAQARVVVLAHGLEPPRDACNTWGALADGLRILRADLMMHFHLENILLFKGPARPEADAALGCGGGRARCGRGA